MAVNFTQAQKKQKYLLLVLAAVVFLILLVVWLNFAKKEVSLPLPLAAPAVLPFQGLEIDWQVLKDEKLKELKLVEEIPEFEEEVGRNNPFTPY